MESRRLQVAVATNDQSSAAIRLWTQQATIAISARWELQLAHAADGQGPAAVRGPLSNWQFWGSG